LITPSLIVSWVALNNFRSNIFIPVTRRLKGYTRIAGKYETGGRKRRIRPYKLYIFLINKMSSVKWNFLKLKTGIVCQPLVTFCLPFSFFLSTSRFKKKLFQTFRNSKSRILQNLFLSTVSPRLYTLYNLKTWKL